MEDDADTFPDQMDRNGTGLRITYKFINGRVQDFATSPLGELEVSRKFYAPYIFIDPPSKFTSNWESGDWQLALGAAKSRSSSTSGMVVAIAHPTQVAFAFDAMLQVISSEYVPHVMTANLNHSVKRSDFPRHSLLLVVSFWGDPAIAGTSRAATSTSSVWGGGALPNDLKLDNNFLKFGLTDVIQLPRVEVWTQNLTISTATPFVSLEAKRQPVDTEQRPLDLYLYFLVGFKFPNCMQAGACCVFDLCCGSGTASLAANLCSHNAIGIDTDAYKIQQCQLRMMQDHGHWSKAVKRSALAPDFFMSKTMKMSLNNLPTDQVLKANGWMAVETFPDRLYGSLNNAGAEEEGEEDDDGNKTDEFMGRS